MVEAYRTHVRDRKRAPRARARRAKGGGRCRTGTSRLPHVLLSDRDLVSEVKSGQLQLDPFEPALVQPSSIDVRLDRWFRVFNNHLYTHIDPAQRQDDLTTLLETEEGQPFVLHPGEFVLALTLELSNVANLPITLWPGMKIGQLCIFRLSSPAEHPYGAAVYGSRYQGQRGPTPSRAWQSWRTWSTRGADPAEADQPESR